MTVKQLAEKRQKLVADARAILDLADKEKRSMTTDESAKYDKLMGEADAVFAQMQEAHGSEARRKRLEESEAAAARLLPRESGLGGERGDGDTDPEERAAGRGAGRYGNERELRYHPSVGGRRVVGASERVFEFDGVTASPEYRAAFGRFLRTGDKTECERLHSRAMQADSGPDGGFLIIPQQMAAGILKAADDAVWIRALATVIPIAAAASLGSPTLESNPADAEWTGEVSAVTNDSATKVGKRELKPTQIAKAIQLSRRLMRLAPNVETFVQDRLTYKFAITMEKGYLTGDGANKPLGLFTASSFGISTARDFATDNTSTAITDLGIINTFYSLKKAYRDDPTCRWLFHRDAIKQVRKLKDSVGGYLWKPGRGIEGNDGDTLMGKPVAESEYCPNTFTTGQYVGLFGAFRYYWVADSLAMEIQRLEEIAARTNQVEFIGRAESDGMPVIEEAFSRVKLG